MVYIGQPQRMTSRNKTIMSFGRVRSLCLHFYTMFYTLQFIYLVTMVKIKDASYGLSEAASPSVLTKCPYASCYNTEQCETGRPAFKQVRQERKSVAPCFCDINFLVFGDCCYNFFPTCLGFTLRYREQIKHHRKLMYTKYQDIKLESLMKCSECLPVTNGNKEHYIMVSDCPTKELKDVNVKCQNQSLSDFGQIPVSLVAYPYLTFTNIFCAICHGFERNDVQFWNASAVCPKSMNLSMISQTNLRTLSKICFIDAKPPSSVSPRPCHSLANLPPSNMYPEEDLCPVYQYVVKDKNNLLYKNPDCAKPTLGPGGDIIHDLDCVWSQISMNQSQIASTITPNSTAVEMFGPFRPSVNPDGSAYGVGSLNILFQFTDRGLSFVTDSHRHRVVERVQYCSLGQVYDFYIDRCKNLTCPHHRKPVNGACVLRDLQVAENAHNIEIENNTSYWIILNSLTGHFVSTNNETKVRLPITNNVRYCFQQIKNVTVLNATGYNYEECIFSNSTETFLEAHFEYPNNTTQFLLNVNIQLLSLDYMVGAIDCLYNVSAYSLDLFSLQQVLIVNTNPNTCSFCSNNSVMSHTEISVSNKTYLRHHTLHSISENGVLGIFSSKGDKTWLLSCEDRLAVDNILHCAHGSLSYDSSEYTMENQTVTLKESGKSYSPGSYIMQDSYVIVCNREFMSQYRTNYTDIFFCYDSTQEIIAIVTSSVSMLSLVTVLLVYWLLPSLRANNAGKIIMSLSGTMLLAQGLLVIVKLPRDYHVICVVTAALTHWAWLSTFTWMTVLSVDLTRAIRGMLPSNPHLTTRPFCWYALVAWVIPLLFVVTSVLIDHLNLSNLHIGYGGPNSCWIANADAVIALFGVPASITLLLNIGCFVLTFAAIESTSRAMSELKSRSRSNKRRLGVYIRLVFIMGFTWIFSFVAALSRVEVLAYCHLVFNGIQGFYILLAFVFKRRVAFLLLTVWNKRRLQEKVSTLSNQM